MRFSLMLLTATLIAGCSNQPPLADNAPEVLLNSKVGFSVPGYSYNQDGLTCNLDQRLVRDLIDSAARQQIRLTPTADAGALKQAKSSLAIDIEKLVVNNAQRNFVGHQAQEPQLGISAALIDSRLEQGFELTDRHCVAFSDQMGLDSAGANSTCTQLYRCSARLSDDIAKWLAEQLPR